MTCIAASLTMAAAAAAPAVRFYVTTEGRDTSPGSADAPFATLERARDAIRALKTKGPLPAGGVEVTMQAGTYERAVAFELTDADSGTADAPVIYRAAPDAEVRIMGGRMLPSEAFQPVTDPAVLRVMDSAAAGNVLMVDLGALGVPTPPACPPKFRGPFPAPELFVNDRRMRLAQWPTDGWATVAKIIDAGSCPRKGDKSNRPGVIEYDGNRPERWDAKRGVWLLGYWCFDWYEEVLQVRSIDTKTRQITFMKPAHYSVRQGNPSPRRYRAINLLEELDGPGEYYVDPQANRLYLWPPCSLANARVTLSLLEAPVIAVTDASHVTLRGLTVEAAKGDGIVVRGGTTNSILACVVRNIRKQGIVVEGGTRHRVEACDIHDTGTGGLRLSGGSRKPLTPAGHEAVNNHIHRFSCHQMTYANGLMLAGVGNRGAHNLIHDAPHQGIGVSGNDHVFEYNVVHHVCTETDDCGAFYKGRNPSCRGNIVRYNFWHNIGGPMGHGNAAVYFDDGDGGETVLGNVFFRCGDPGKGRFGTVFSHGGHDILAENNIFIECKRALGSAPWNHKRWKGMIDGALWQERLLKEVDITRPPYTTHYPALVGFMEPKKEDKRVSVAVRNLIVMGADVSSGNWQVSETENLITDGDPGFVDPAKGDFRLRADSAVFAKLPGFKPVPFERMGLIASELRPNPVRETWPYAPPKPLPPLAKRTSTTMKPRRGPAPVFKVRKAATPITVDGTVSSDEWFGTDPAKAMPLAMDYGGAPAKRTSKAWLAYDHTALYIAVENAIDPATTFDGNAWGGDDAVEVSLRVARKGAKDLPIHVLRGFGNGYLRYGTTPNGDDDPGAMEPAGIVFKATRPAKDSWVAEFAIPLAMIDVDPAEDTRLAFSLAVRKTRDNLWLMWEGTRGNSYNVDRAGFIELAR